MKPLLLKCGFEVPGLVGFGGDSQVGDAGGVFWLGCLGQNEFSGIEGGSIAFFGVSGLGRLGGRFGVEGTQGEAVGGSWTPGASPILESDIGLAVRVFVFGS